MWASFRIWGVCIFHADASASWVLDNYFTWEEFYVFKVERSGFIIYCKYSKESMYLFKLFEKDCAHCSINIYQLFNWKQYLVCDKVILWRRIPWAIYPFPSYIHPSSFEPFCFLVNLLEASAYQALHLALGTGLKVPLLPSRSLSSGEDWMNHGLLYTVGALMKSDTGRCQWCCPPRRIAFPPTPIPAGFSKQHLAWIFKSEHWFAKAVLL